MGAEQNVNILFANISSTLTLVTLIFPHFLSRYWLDTIQFELKKHRRISHPWKAMPTLPTLFQNSKHTDSIITDLQNAHYNHLKHIFLQLLTSICGLKQKYQSLGLSPWLGLLRFQARPKPTSNPHLGQGLRPSMAHHYLLYLTRKIKEKIIILDRKSVV